VLSSFWVSIPWDSWNSLGMMISKTVSLLLQWNVNSYLWLHSLLNPTPMAEIIITFCNMSFFIHSSYFQLICV
jgi:hypothetical protein